MNRADTVFQESFLGELQRLENGGEGSEPTAIDKLAAAAGLLDDAPAAADKPAGETTYDSLLAKLAGDPSGGLGIGATKPTMGERMRDLGSKAKGAFGKAKESVTGAAKAVGAKAQAGGAWMKAHPKTSVGVGAGLAAAGGYAAYRAMKKKDKDD